MAQPGSIAKELSSCHADRRIRVLIAESEGFSATTFSEAEIERIVEILGLVIVLGSKGGEKIEPSKNAGR